MTATGILTAFFTARSKALLGVRPAVARALQSSILLAPPASAAMQDSTEVATTSIKGVRLAGVRMVGQITSEKMKIARRP
jgi:hypothetical protein